MDTFLMTGDRRVGNVFLLPTISIQVISAIGNFSGLNFIKNEECVTLSY
ncbi:hypothetical protein BGP_3645 [Beggiatoa sp. PS]|nr:hypothetical protein BGP_3645 [Beggiatoa sp. PS]